MQILKSPEYEKIILFIALLNALPEASLLSAEQFSLH